MTEQFSKEFLEKSLHSPIANQVRNYIINGITPYQVIESLVIELEKLLGIKIPQEKHPELKTNPTNSESFPSYFYQNGGD